MLGTLLLIQLICVLVTDVAGAPEDMLMPLIRKITKVGTLRDKPWNCSLCQCWWLSLIYLIFTHQLSIASIALSLALACLTPLTLALWHLANDFIMKMINTIYDYFHL
jgi:hypothetical protein